MAKNEESTPIGTTSEGYEHDALGKRTVLIVDDGDINRAILSAILESDFNILEAENGQVGLEVLQAHYASISIICLDIQMPVMDGYAFLEAKQSDELLRSIPVIVTTASDDPDEEVRSLQHGASDFITKPYQPEIAKCRINNIISLREAASTLQAVEFDQLTNIFSRQAFLHYASEMMQANRKLTFDLVVADVAEFSMLNERYGRNACDNALRIAGDFFRTKNSKTVFAGRIGGDDFALFMPHNSIDIQGTLKDLKDFLLENLPNTIGKSIITRIKSCAYRNFDVSVDLNVAIDCAEAQIEEIKGFYDVSHTEFDDNARADMNRRRWMEENMEESLSRGEFVPYYQPKHDTQTGELVGAEALVRWISDEGGFISPGDFIPLLETNGFIAKVDEAIWFKTAENQRKWIDEGLDVVPISVNASRFDFNQLNLVEKRMEAFNKYDLDHALLHLEVTESLFTDNIQELIKSLEAFRAQGVRIELDDFGVGYSSLNSLAEIPLDIVKLDMTFLKDLDKPNNMKILSACIKLANNIGLKTVSEGVETADQLKAIQNLGGNVIQGFYFSKPLPQNEFENYLKQHAKKS